MYTTNYITIKTINCHCTVVYSHVREGAGIDTTVFSYDTPVLRVDNESNIHRLWSGWSTTTQRDINKAVNVNMTKSKWDSMKVEEA